MQLSLATGDGNLQEIFSWTDTDNPFGVRYMVFQHRQLASATNVANVKLRNLRNPDQAHTIIKHLNSPDLFCFNKTYHDIMISKEPITTVRTELDKTVCYQKLREVLYDPMCRTLLRALTMLAALIVCL